MRKLTICIAAVCMLAACKKNLKHYDIQPLVIHDTVYYDYTGKLTGSWLPVDTKHKSLNISKDSISWDEQPALRYICTSDSIFEVISGNRYLPIYSYTFSKNFDSITFYGVTSTNPVYHYYRKN